MISSKKLVEDYTRKRDWRVNENSNAPESIGALGRYIIGEVSKDYWLREVYSEEIVQAYREGFFHLHDLGGLTLYCCGYSLRSLIMMGIKGIPNIPDSAPAKHFGAILNQLANVTTIFQNEIMGAVAFSSFDTLLAPFVKEDKLSYEEVKQHMQNYIFSINSNSRGGAEPAFSNITLDLTPPKDLLNEKVLVGGKMLDYTYKDCQEEMNMINRAFYELMLAGDASGKPFAYPIPTYNIHERFDWDNPNNDLLWEMAGKYGYPYFANFINSDMNPEDVRSMCCRMNLDLTELKRRGGGLFGSGESTGSIGVVTLNLPRIAYLNRGNKKKFYEMLDHHMVLAKDSLEIKRKFLQEEILDGGYVPAFKTYVGTLNNHFSTIGLVGMNEMAMNFLGEDILTEAGIRFGVEVLESMRARLIDFQKETGNLYNLEATPAESTAYRLAKKDKQMYPDIYTQENDGVPYYTNSCHIPVNKVESIKQLFDHQDNFQHLATGGTVVHVFLSGPISGAQAKRIIHQVCHNYKVPYISLSPLNCYCPTHGHLSTPTQHCPYCGQETDMLQRVTGYLRNVKYFNDGKKAEFRDRVQLVVK